MALSGTLDTFALPDVLRLLSSTAKTGRLRITGDRGSGSVWVESGDIVATELASTASQDPPNDEVVFGLLRFGAGSFTFEGDARAANAGTPQGMESILGAAENMLVEWRSIEEVVPSLDVWVGLTPELVGPDVMIDGARWGGIAAIGSGAQVGAVAEALALNEIDTCRMVKELVELGLIELIDEPSSAPAATSFEPQPEAFEVPETEPEYAEPEPEAEEFFTADTGIVPSLASLEPSAEQIDPLLPVGDPLDDLTYDRASDDIFGDAPSSGLGDDGELDPAEMARQLANLSPKAAKAVAAAARATTDAERDAALAAVEAEDDSVNRGLLLKFLGSVDS